MNCTLSFFLSDGILINESPRNQQGPCDLMLCGQAPHWDILPLQSPQRVAGHWLNRVRGRGPWGEQVQSNEWGNSCGHLLSFWGPGPFKRPLTCLVATRSPSQAPCPVSMTPRFGLTPAHVPSHPWGAGSFVMEHGRGVELRGEERDGELHG